MLPEDAARFVSGLRADNARLKSERDDWLSQRDEARANNERLRADNRRLGSQLVTREKQMEADAHMYHANLAQYERACEYNFNLALSDGPAWLVKLESHHGPIRERAEKAEHERDDLLARIHRDGGHYAVEHGVDQALADADKIVADLFGERDELRAENERLRKQYVRPGVIGDCYGLPCKSADPGSEILCPACATRVIAELRAELGHALASEKQLRGFLNEQITRANKFEAGNIRLRGAIRTFSAHYHTSQLHHLRDLVTRARGTKRCQICGASHVKNQPHDEDCPVGKIDGGGGCGDCGDCEPNNSRVLCAHGVMGDCEECGE